MPDWVYFFFDGSLGPIDWSGLWDTLAGPVGVLSGVIAIAGPVAGLIWWLISKRGKRLPKRAPPMALTNKRKVFGRDTEADDLRALLTQHGQGAVVPTLHGGGGVGKTTLCVHYANRYSADYDRIGHLRANPQRSVKDDLSGIVFANNALARSY
ncbi:MAG: hypothetical protein AAF218_06835 [Pseudomonadota bacterium]